jgi:hypothetical protein
MVWKAIKECRNAWGYAKGSKGCVCCGDRFSWKASHSTRYIVKIPGASVIRSVAPLCEECFAELPPAERLEFYLDHCGMEGEQGRSVTTQDWRAIRLALQEEK